MSSPSSSLPSRTLDVAIVGAGPAGIGCALALRACGVENTAILDAAGVGASFNAWPRQMTLLTPSFHSNAFGSTDLNAVTPDTSPADFLHTQHPSGPDYARYLQALVIHYGLEVCAPVRVNRVEPPSAPGGEFLLHTSSSPKPVRARHVIWTAGEFGTPDDGGIEGASLCLHNSRVRDWDDIAAPGEKVTLIGGYESGIDAAIHLMEAGREVHLLSKGEPWATDDPDPSRSLSPRTRDRLKHALLHAPGSIQFYKNAHIVSVEKSDHGFFTLRDADGIPFASPHPPILCTGFQSALRPIADLWEWQGDYPVFSEAADESTLTPGLFYSGPSLRQRGMLFCFIYKFRARFGVIAREISDRLGVEPGDEFDLWKERGFVLDDLSCCNDCQCAVEPEPDADAQTPPLIAYATVVEN